MKPTLATITSPLPPLQIRFVGQQICTSYSVDKRSNFTYHIAPSTYCMTTNTTMSQGNEIFHTCILWILKCVTETVGCETSHKYTKYTVNFMFVVPYITRLLLIIVHRDATMSSLFIYYKVTLHVSGVVAPIIRST